MQFLKVQVSWLLGAAGKAEIKIESEETCFKCYCYNLTQLQQSAVIIQGESLPKKKKPACASSSLI